MVHRHIILFTYPTQGAINPSLQLAKRLITMGVKVTILTCVSAHRRMAKTTTTTPPEQGLTFVAFSDGYDDGFQDGDDYQHFLSQLKDRGSKALADLITASAQAAGHPPVTGLVYTMLQSWVAKVARSFHIPSSLLWTQPATLFRIYFFYFNGYGDAIRKIIDDDPSCSVELPELPRLSSRDLPSIFLPTISEAFKLLLLTFKEQLDTLDAEAANPKILVNTFDALEPEALRAIHEKLKLIAIGPLVPSPFLDGKYSSDTCFGVDLFQKSSDYVEWLDLKPESSVVYVSFGSMAVLPKRQIEEIARGLLESNRPFLWVIRAKENGEKQEDGLISCREELEQLGMIVPWCSQLEVLSHPSLGCFVTHCGWNSSLECLASGVPVVGFPQMVDQLTNAKLIEDVFKTGVRVTANEEGIVEGDEIKRCIEVIMGGGEKWEEMNINAKKWSYLAKEAAKEGGSSYMNLRAFVDEVEENF